MHSVSCTHTIEMDVCNGMVEFYRVKEIRHKRVVTVGLHLYKIPKQQTKLCCFTMVVNGGKIIKKKKEAVIIKSRTVLPLGRGGLLPLGRDRRERFKGTSNVLFLDLIIG